MRKQLLFAFLILSLLSFSARAQVGFTCDNPIEIVSLPYQVLDNTLNYGNSILGPQSDNCGAVPFSVNYLSGNDVVYRFTATQTGFISISMTPGGTRSSVFVYGECAEIGVSCLAGVANTTTNPRIINQFAVTVEEDYYIVISSNATTPTVGYELVMQYENCQKPTNLTFDQANATLTGGTLSWVEAGTATSWQIAVQNAGELVPADSGNYVDNDGVPGITINNLQTAHLYQYWVRSVCAAGGFSAWAGPFVFNTLICQPQYQCTYTFRMTDSANNGWNGARMQIRQNGIILPNSTGQLTIGGNYNSGAGPVDVTVLMCNDIPFDIFWITAGAQPQQCILSVINPFGQSIYSKPAGAGTPGEIIQIGNIDCSAPICNLPPTNVTISDITTLGAIINWDAPATENLGFEIFVLPSGEPAPTFSTMPTFSGVNGPTAPFSFTAPNILMADTTYDVYVRVDCEPTSVCSPVVTFTTLPTCPKPINQSVVLGSITTTEATLNWTENGSATEWEVLLLAGPDIPQPPGAVPFVNLDDIYLINLATTTVTPTLQPATIYYYYVRSICSEEDKSNWAGPYLFNTVTCNDTEKCQYKFLLTDAGSNGWNGGRMQVKQNGIVVSTLGPAFNSGPGPVTTNVLLCNNVPFELYWSILGTAPQEMGVTILDPFGNVIFMNLPGEGSPLTILFTEVGACMAPTCPKPNQLLATQESLTYNTAELEWTEIGDANQWEVYVAETEAPLPVNGTPVSGNPPYYTANTNPFTVDGLQPATNYTYYVRSICSPTDISTWTIFNPKTFTTKPINDECQNAIVAPINQEMQGNLFVTGTTLGATPSSQPSTCTESSNIDVWFKFVATSAVHVINLNSIQGGTTQVGHVLYTGSQCANMTQMYCINTALSSLATGLTIGETYFLKVFTYGLNATEPIAFNVKITTSQLGTLVNDESINALPLTVNISNDCTYSIYGSLIGATSSNLPNTCLGTADDDVWFSFVPTSDRQIISISGVVGTTTNIKYGVYSGNPDSLVEVYCSYSNSLLDSSYLNYIPGQTYYVRVWSAEETPQSTLFNICIKSVSTCENATAYCKPSIDKPYIFQNNIGIPNNIEVACLGTIPNPTYFALKITEPGTLIFDIMQSTSFDDNENPNGNAMDVDFVAWGPFSSLDSCSQISFTECPECPEINDENPSFYPFGNIVDCSYSGSYVETFTIQNALVGEYYMLLITNFNGSAGYIKLEQNNSNEPGAGSTICGDKLQLVAFVDQNANNIKDANEINFTYGSFTHQKNNIGPVSLVSSPSGKLNIYDTNPANLYDLGYQIDQEYSAYYSLAPSNYNDINIVQGSGTQYIYFPITVAQGYNDISVSIIPSSNPVPGFSYSNIIIYKNNGTLPVFGTLTFTKDSSIAITNISQAGTVASSNGFTFDFNNLLPSQTRYMSVTMLVPPIPNANINDVLTNTVVLTTLETDTDISNNNAAISQVVMGAYDPNDKIEAHGGSVDFNSFTQNDYLIYTIRFQNTGTANAINVKIEDALNEQLDETTIRMISASHDYVMERINNKLIWTFENIQLPPQITNETASNGYLTFKIKPKPDFEVGDIIPNFAEIYFDTNPAIITNTFNSEFEIQLAAPEFTAGNINVYPNPSNGLVYINVQNTNENLNTIQLYDVLGKRVLASKSLTSKQSTIDVSALAKGVYMLEITTENNLRQTKKLVVH